MKKMNRKIMAAIICLSMLAAIAVALSWTWRVRTAAVTAGFAQTVTEHPDPLQRFRTEREQLRRRRQAELNDIIHDAKTDAETLALAQRQLMAQLSAEDAEVRLEGLLGVRGFDGAVVSVSEGAVNVLIHRETITRQETAVILDLALRETGVSGGNVKIIPVC